MFALYVARAFADSLSIWTDAPTHVDQLLKSKLVDFICNLQDNECLTTATETFKSIPKVYFLNPNNVSTT